MEEEMRKFRAEFGDRVRTKRVEANMTQEELAKALGYSDENGKGMVSKIENGKTEPPLNKLNTFARVLNTSIVYLMGWDKLRKVDEKETTMRAWMTDQEGLLITMFRQLNSSGQQTVLSMISVMLLNKDFTSLSNQDTASKAG